VNILSCDGCGVLLDADKLDFPTDIWKDTEFPEVDETKGTWDYKKEKNAPYVNCPVCKEKVLK